MMINQLIVLFLVLPKMIYSLSNIKIMRDFLHSGHRYRLNSIITDSLFNSDDEEVELEVPVHLQENRLYVEGVCRAVLGKNTKDGRNRKIVSTYSCNCNAFPYIGCQLIYIFSRCWL